MTGCRLTWSWVVAAAAATVGCTTAPLAPVPVPLPEVDEWAAAPDRGAFLGLNTEENDSRSLDALYFEPGVRVTRVVQNSPAEGAGLVAGDVVLHFDGHETNNPAELDALVAALQPAAAATLSVRRGDAVFDVPVTLAPRAGAAFPRDDLLPTWILDPAASRAGWSDGDGGVRLASTAPDSPVTAAGLVIGDVVTALDGRSVRSARALLRRIQARPAGSTVVLTVAAGGGTRDVEIDLATSPRRLTDFHIPILVSYEADAEGEHARLEILDLWLFSFFRYERVGRERTWTLLEFFDVSTGVGQLAE